MNTSIEDETDRIPALEKNETPIPTYLMHEVMGVKEKMPTSEQEEAYTQPKSSGKEVRQSAETEGAQIFTY